MTDTTTKLPLASIALGLWANFGGSQLRPAFAQDYISVLRKIESDVGRIQAGTCSNSKIC